MKNPARADLTMTRKMRTVLAHVPAEWQNMSTSPNDKTVKSLEKRGLIELRVDQTISPNQATMQTLLGDHSHWQIRRVI